MLAVVILGQSAALLWFSCLLYATRHRVKELERDGTAALLRRDRDVLGESLGFVRADNAKLRKDLEALTGRVAELASLSLAESPDVAALRKDLALKTKQIEGLQNWCGQLEKANESILASLATHVTNAVANTLYRLATSVKDQPSA